MSPHVTPRIAPGTRSEVGVFAWAFAHVAGRVTHSNPPNLFLTMGRRPKLFRGWLRFAANTYAPDDHGIWHPRWDIRIAEALRNNGAPELWGPFGALSHVPLMLVRGEVSALLSAETAARMRQERPDMVFVNVAECGHSPSLEEAVVVPALDRFLDAIP